jgi:hypothetical protein
MERNVTEAVSDLLTPAEFGRGLEKPVTPARVRQLVDSGAIRAVRTSAGARLIPKTELLRFGVFRRRQAAEE